jgi:hypothetical protein
MRADHGSAENKERIVKESNTGWSAGRRRNEEKEVKETKERKKNAKRRSKLTGSTRSKQ